MIVYFDNEQGSIVIDTIYLCPVCNKWYGVARPFTLKNSSQPHTGETEMCEPVPMPTGRNSR
jgi:hypothetical protein